ncbi:alpha/beta fold hydrolase [Nocardia sp. NPDC005998]|uniref:alpha/beta fold hydrolase n=1 Tax=Nocardia sp. NPDC005998 TaxID=3156894 RepID=UPI0033BC21AC
MTTFVEPTVRCDMTISLDGFICGMEARKPPFLDDGFFRVTNWIVKHFAWQQQHGLSGSTTVPAATDPEAELVTERIEQTGAYVLGRRMYDSAGSAWDEQSPYHVPTFVVTHRRQESRALADGTVFHFETGGPAAAIARAKEVCREAGEGKNVHVSGGASLVQQAISAGLVDELHIHIAPVLLGQGTRLFDNLPDGIVELERYRVVDSADATHLSFRIPRSIEENTTMIPASTPSTVISRDGTTLAVETIGAGAPVILIGGAFNDRSTVTALAAALAPEFTAVTYDRRARGGSDDRSTEYALQSELDDLAAVITHVGGRACVFGHSSGGILALEAVMHGLAIDRVAVYETPYLVDDTRPAPSAGARDRLTGLVRSGDLEAAVALFLQENVGVPAEMVASMQTGDEWAFLVGNAASLPYDALVTGDDLALPTDRLAAVTIPTLAIYGDQTWPWLAAGTQAVGTAVGVAETRVLEGEDHGVLARPEALVPTLRKFFG